MLSTDRLRSFHDNGYLVLREALPPERVAKALQRINHDLGSNGAPPADLPEYRARSWCPAIQRHGDLIDCFDSSVVHEATEDLCGRGQILPVGSFQVALRFPLDVRTPRKPPRGHLDGIGTGINGIAKGSFQRGFTGLAVMLLSDLPEPDMGNFTVWPGSHRRLAEFFHLHGHEGLGEIGTPEVGQTDEPGLQITGRAGDVVLTHHLLIHTAAANHSPHIRYAIICRFRHRDCAAVAERAFSDPWHEWPGVRAAMTMT